MTIHENRVQSLPGITLPSIGWDLTMFRLFADKSAWWYRWQWAGKYRFRFAHDRLAIGVNLGMQAGYLAGGLFADLWLLKAEAGTYFKEAGTYPGQKKEQRIAFMVYTETSF